MRSFTKIGVIPKEGKDGDDSSSKGAFRKLTLLALSKKHTVDRKSEITEDNLIYQLKEANMLSKPAVEKIYETLLARTRFRYSYQEIIQYIYKCVCFRKVSKKTKANKRHFYYHKAERKLKEEMDILNVIRSIRKLKLMAKIIFPERARTLLKFSRRNLLESASSSCDSDIYNYDTFKLIHSKVDLVRASA